MANHPGPVEGELLELLNANPDRYRLSEDDVRGLTKGLTELLRQMLNWNELFDSESPQSPQEHRKAVRQNTRAIVSRLNSFKELSDHCGEVLGEQLTVDGNPIVTVEVKDDGLLYFHTDVYQAALLKAVSGATRLTEDLVCHANSKLLSSEPTWELIRDRKHDGRFLVERIVSLCRAGAVLGRSLLGASYPASLEAVRNSVFACLSSTDATGDPSESQNGCRKKRMYELYMSKEMSLEDALEAFNQEAIREGWRTVDSTRTIIRNAKAWAESQSLPFKERCHGAPKRDH